MISVRFIKIYLFYGLIYRRRNPNFDLPLSIIISSIALGIFALFGEETENDDDDSDSGSGGLMQHI